MSTTYSEAQFWKASEAGVDPYKVVVPIVDKLFMHQDERYVAYRRLAEIYGADMTSRGGIVSAFAKAFDENLTMNELANTIETLHSQLYKNRIVVAASSIGGDYGQQSRAKKLTRWADGVLDSCGLHQYLVPRIGLGALIAGTAFFRVGHVVKDEKRKLAEITIDAVDALDMAVDPMDAEDGKPRCIFQRGRADRTALGDAVLVKDSSLYGSLSYRKEAVEKGKTLRDLYAADADVSILDLDTVVVYEAWRRATARTPGRYIMCTSAGTLIDREYEFQDTPHVPLRWMMGPSGYYGQSAVARLTPGQRVYDKLNIRGDRAHDLMGVPRLIVRKGAGINKLHIDDVEGSIIEADDPSGVKEWIATPMHPDFYRERDSIPQKMRALIGVSQFSANGSLPTQLREASGVALENFVDQESARHSMPHREYETAIVNLVYRIIDEALWLQERGYSVTAHCYDRGHLEEIDFKDVKMDRSEFKLRVLPVSHLSRTFTGKVNQLNPLLERGAIKLPTYRRLLEVPDIEAENDIDTSTDELVDALLSQIYETGEPLDVLSFDDAARIVERGTKFINFLRLKKVSSEKLLPVVMYVEEAFKKMQPPAPPPGMPPMDPAQGAAGPGGMPTEMPPEAMMPGPPEGMPPDGMPPEGVPV
jgi:hypothetical protein